MKAFISTLVVIFSIVMSFGFYQHHQQKQVEKYWLKMANDAVVNNNTKFVEFYNKYLHSLQTISISEGWEMYERYCNK